MDAVAQLALMSKAKKVFEKEGTYLSFPVTPLAYEKEDLEFFTQETADQLRRSQANLEAFSTLVNLIPGGEAWLPTDARFLWDELDYVLREATLASSSRTPEEEVRFQQAKEVLKVPGEEGLLQDSPKVQIYNQYKDAYIMAEQEFMEAKSSGETTDNEEEKRQWREVDEPALRAKLTDLDTQWVLEGYKHEIDAARSTYQNLGAKSPTLSWDEWKGRFNPDLDSHTSAQDNSTIFPSSFMPANALEEGSWNPFSLNANEITSLVNDAPAELRQRFSADGKQSSIKAMELEFSSAAIKRPWFDSELFRSRFWRLRDTSKSLSDGQTPPSGDCPAYVAAIVFARNVVVEEADRARPASPTTASTGLKFNYAVKNQAAVQRINPAMLKALQPKPLILQPVKPQIRNLQPHRPVMMSAKPHMTVARSPAALRVASRPASGPVLTRPAAVAPAAVRPTVSRSMVQLQAAKFTRLQTVPVRKPAANSANTSPASTPVPDNHIYIFAFICKPLPKCPNPDPDLQW